MAWEALRQPGCVPSRVLCCLTLCAACCVQSMPELVLLCNEAAARGNSRDSGVKGHHDKPIDLEYLADRL